MTTYIALLRAVNVGGTSAVKMDALREMVAGLGFTEVQSLLQTGNLVFTGKAADRAEVEGLIEVDAEKRLGLATTVVVRTADDWAEIIARNPFADEAKDDPSHLLVMLLKTTPSAEAEALLQAAVAGRERVRVIRHAAYLVYPDGVGRSKLTAVLAERKLGARGTARNWNTVMKLAALAGV
jgi:uncharacterized protein (DUF1697 family)